MAECSRGLTAQERFYKNLGMAFERFTIMDAENHKQTSEFLVNLSTLPEIFENLSDECSPIEELLLSEIMFITDGFNPVQHLEFPEEHLVFGTWFECQYKVGKYRADFVFEVCVNGETQRVLVECDGHDYHEKTKEQAARDKKRDRYFTGQGYSILRFTGSEIFKSPEDCAEEIHELLSDVSSRLVRAHLDKGE